MACRPCFAHNSFASFVSFLGWRGCVILLLNGWINGKKEEKVLKWKWKVHDLRWLPFFDHFELSQAKCIRKTSIQNRHSKTCKTHGGRVFTAIRCLSCKAVLLSSPPAGADCLPGRLMAARWWSHTDTRTRVAHPSAKIYLGQPHDTRLAFQRRRKRFGQETLTLP